MIKIKTLADAKGLKGEHCFLRAHIPVACHDILLQTTPFSEIGYCNKLFTVRSQSARYSDKLVYFKDQQPSILKHPEFFPPRHIKANAAFSMCPWNFEGCESIEDVLNCFSSDDCEGFK